MALLIIEGEAASPHYRRGRGTPYYYEIPRHSSSGEAAALLIERCDPAGWFALLRRHKLTV